MKVLIVEDVPFMAKFAQRILQDGQVESDIALAVDEAERLVNQNDYDAILMDFGMPVMTGLELTRVLRDKGFNKPIIGLTANADEYAEADMIAVGLNTCLSKPLQFTDIALFSRDPSLGWWANNGRDDDDKA